MAASHAETIKTRLAMRKVNTSDLREYPWSSPKGTFAGAGKELSEALGRQPHSTDWKERHPFDVEICRIPRGKSAYPYHSHSVNGSFTSSFLEVALSVTVTGQLLSELGMRFFSRRTNRISS